MIWYCHLVECNAFGVLKKAIRSPNIVQPFHVQYSIFLAHVFGQSQSMVAPTLCKKYIGYVSLECLYSL